MRRISGVVALLAAVVAATLAVPEAADAGPVGATTGTSAARGSTALVATRVIGHTVKGRKIKAYRIGDPTSPVKAVFIGTIHGNEAGPAKLLMNLVTGTPVSGADIWVVPYLNRDGFARHTRRNAHRVDLNRNFPVHWIRQHGTYNSGRRPASEPETRAIMRFLKAVRPAYVVSFHQPLNGVDNSYRKTRALAARLSTNLDLPLKVFNCNRGCHGTLTQWFNKLLPGAALTVEYGKPMTTRQKYVTGPPGLLAAIGATR
jgi:predicted deacylase